MPFHVRARGARWELRVRHRLLPRPMYRTFDAEAAATAYGEQLAALLDRGIVPAELLAPEPRSADDPLVTVVVRSYINQAPHVSRSDESLLTMMYTELTGLRLSAITYRWAMDYVRACKRGEIGPRAMPGVGRGQPMAPGTIRKRIGTLARVIDWHLACAAAPDTPQPPNALRLLPVGYSQYTPAEERELEARGQAAPGDVQRDRRLCSEEDRTIRAALAGGKRPGRERAWGPDPAMALLYAVIVDTGLRLREAYTLRVDQVDLDRGVLRVSGTKGVRGRAKPRVVPLKRCLRDELRGWCAARPAGGLVWDFWTGQPEDLTRATARLSARFATLFAYAGVSGVTEHDLRHEAACRWFELRDDAGRWVFSDVEIARIMGWTDLRMALRYASLRGEDLAARLN